MDWKVPFSELKIEEDEIREVENVLKSGWLSFGQKTSEFERCLSETLKIKYAIAVSNGTSALHLGLKAVDINPGDEVLVPSLTFVASANSVLTVGAKPVFCDITGHNDLTISCEEIEKKISHRTKAIMAVHYAGYPCNMERIMEIAKVKKLKVIEDSAHAPAVPYNDKYLGCIGDVGCFSFFANKNMSTGEGGMIAVSNKKYADYIRLMRSHGMTTTTLDRFKGHSYTYDVVTYGFNYRITEIQSAIGTMQLKKIKSINNIRKKLAAEYVNRLKGLDIIIPFKDFNGSSAYHIFPILVKNKEVRNDLIKRIKDAGIQCSIHYPPIHLFSYYRDKFNSKEGDLPLTEDVADRLITLPLFNTMTIDQIDYVVSSIKKILN